MSELKYTGFLPAKKLNFSAQEKKAAVKVLKMLEEGKLKGRDWMKEAQMPGETGCVFNMGQVLHRDQTCGTVGCIAGWMAAHMGRSDLQADHLFQQMYHRSAELHNLFMAQGYSRSYMESAQPKNGARALRNYLETGKVDWDKAMDRPR